LPKKSAPSASPPQERYGNVTVEALQKATGKTWAEWFAILDEAGATKMTHREIAQWLRGHLESGWWRQSVTVAYEQARDMREVHQRKSGFSVSVSKVLPFPVAEVQAAWADAAKRKRWLPESSQLEINTAQAVKTPTMRGQWLRDGSKITVYFTDKGSAKTQLVVQVEKLAKTEAVETARAFWKGALVKLQGFLEG
jgi:hypothetical protein